MQHPKKKHCLDVIVPSSQQNTQTTDKNGIILSCDAQVCASPANLFHGVDVLSAPHGCCQKCNCDEESKNEYIYIYICAAEHNFAAFCVRVQYVNTLNLFFKD